MPQHSYHKTIDEFKAEIMLGSGLSSPTRYHVSTWLGTFYPEMVSLPARSFSVFTDSMFGAVRQYPYRRQYNTEIVMTFPLAEDQFERTMMELWMDFIVGKSERIDTGSVMVNDPESMEISVLNHKDETTGIYKIYGAYPTSIIPANYGYAMINEYAKIQVTFNYRKYDFTGP